MNNDGMNEEQAKEIESVKMQTLHKYHTITNV